MPVKVRSVLMVSQTFYPVLGGAEKQAYELSKALVRRGIKVTVLTRRTGALPARETLDGVRIERFPTFGSGLADSLWFLLRVFFRMLALRAEYDAVHVHLASSPGVAAVLAGRLTGKRVVVKLGRGRGLDELTLSKGSFAGRLKLKAFSWLKPEMLVLTRDAYDWLSRGEFPGVRPRLFRNGVDTGRYTPPLYGQKLQAKAALGLEPGLAFLTVGRLVPEKRIKEFLEVWAGLLGPDAATKKVKLIIVGKGPEEGAIKRAVEQLGLARIVTVAGPKDDLLPYYRAADVFVLPSLTEGMSNSMLEAMACGMAILASRVDGAKDAVADGVSGLLFDPLNPAELARRLRELLDDPGLALRLGEKARAAAVENYSMARVAEEALKIYEGD